MLKGEAKWVAEEDKGRGYKENMSHLQGTYYRSNIMMMTYQGTVGINETLNLLALNSVP